MALFYLSADDVLLPLPLFSIAAGPLLYTAKDEAVSLSVGSANSGHIRQDFRDVWLFANEVYEFLKKFLIFK